MSAITKHPDNSEGDTEELYVPSDQDNKEFQDETIE